MSGEQSFRDAYLATPELGPIFGFDVALQMMRQGKAVRRASWRPNTRIILTPDRGIIQSRLGPTQWRWAVDQECVLAGDWELAPGVAE